MNETEIAQVFDEFLQVNPEWTRVKNPKWTRVNCVWIFRLPAHKIEVAFAFLACRDVINIYANSITELRKIHEFKLPIDKSTFFQVAKKVLKCECPFYQLIPFVDPFNLSFVLK